VTFSGICPTGFPNQARIGWFSFLNYWGGALVYFQRELPGFTSWENGETQAAPTNDGLMGSNRIVTSYL
jgi:hypothetical protein